MTDQEDRDLRALALKHAMSFVISHENEYSPGATVQVAEQFHAFLKGENK